MVNEFRFDVYRGFDFVNQRHRIATSRNTSILKVDDNGKIVYARFHDKVNDNYYFVENVELICSCVVYSEDELNYYIEKFTQ